MASQVIHFQKEKNDISHSFQFSVKVYYEDTDAAGVVYYANYLRFLERARTQALQDLGYSHRQLKTLGVMIVVRNIQISYLQSAVLEDELTIASSLRQMRRVGVTFAQDVMRGDVKIAEANVELACVNCRGAVAPWPPLVQKALQDVLEGD